jgi:hypothetical protein
MKKGDCPRAVAFFVFVHRAGQASRRFPYQIR